MKTFTYTKDNFKSSDITSLGLDILHALSIRFTSEEDDGSPGNGGMQGSDGQVVLNVYESADDPVNPDLTEQQLLDLDNYMTTHGYQKA